MKAVCRGRGAGTKPTKSIWGGSDMWDMWVRDGGMCRPGSCGGLDVQTAVFGAARDVQNKGLLMSRPAASSLFAVRRAAVSSGIHVHRALAVPQLRFLKARGQQHREGRQSTGPKKKKSKRRAAWPPGFSGAPESRFLLWHGRQPQSPRARASLEREPHTESPGWACSPQPHGPGKDSDGAESLTLLLASASVSGRRER